MKMDRDEKRYLVIEHLANSCWHWTRRSRSMTWSDELNKEFKEMGDEVVQLARYLIDFVDGKIK